MMRGKLYTLLAGVSLIVIVSAVLIGPLMSRVEQPRYVAVAIEGPVEIREYGPTIVAETQVTGERKAAVNEGFRLLAAYIFGANQPNAKIAMTAPVQQKSVQMIEMTAPVTQKSTGVQWTVRFTMPGNWSLETLPAPNDARVKLLPVPPVRQLAFRFSGLATDETIRAKTEELRDFAKRHKLTIVDQATLAFYDPPWTLPFLRRNEVMFEII
jgi:SOUL heme-binding protein